jgi:hypothetical protein
MDLWPTDWHCLVHIYSNLTHLNEFGWIFCIFKNISYEKLLRKFYSVLKINLELIFERECHKKNNLRKMVKSVFCLKDEKYAQTMAKELHTLHIFLLPAVHPFSAHCVLTN